MLERKLPSAIDTIHNLIYWMRYEGSIEAIVLHTPTGYGTEHKTDGDNTQDATTRTQPGDNGAKDQRRKIENIIFFLWKKWKFIQQFSTRRMFATCVCYGYGLANVALSYALWDQLEH